MTHFNFHCLARLAPRRTVGALLLATSLLVGGACSSSGKGPAGPSVTPLPTVSEPDRATWPKIVALGDSLTAGYGLKSDKMYPVLLQKKVEAAGYKFVVVPAGVSGDTTAGGVRRLDWSMQGDVKVVIVELGANDGLRGLSVSEMRRNLQIIIDRIRARKATVVLCGMETPPNLGKEYAGQFRAVFAELAKQDGVVLLPFFLEGVAGKPELNQEDGIHPNERGTEIVTENVWRVLEPVLARAGTDAK
jgi:acyl-CoA thioesterase-1